MSIQSTYMSPSKIPTQRHPPHSNTGDIMNRFYSEELHAKKGKYLHASVEICIYYNAYLIEFMSFQLRPCQLEIFAIKRILID